MNNRFYLSALLAMIFAFISVSSFSQTEDPQGEIEDVQVEVVKDREIILPPAVRSFSKVPPQNEERPRPVLQYTYPVPQITLSPLSLALRPLRIKDEPLQKTYGNYIALGFGNYITPYGEVFLNSKRERAYTFGIHGKYLSSFRGPVDGANSGDGVMEVDLFGSYFGKLATLNGDLGFRRRHLNFYGYPEGVEVDMDTLSQHFNHIFAEGTLQSNNSEAPFQYAFTVEADHLSDALENRETQAGLKWVSQYNFSQQGALLFNASYDFITFTNDRVEGQLRHLFKIQPRVKFDVMNISIIAGFNAAYENDTLGDGDDLHFYPYAEAGYKFGDNWKVFAKLDGDIEKISYTALTYGNPFLGPGNMAFHTNRTFAFLGGIKGSVNQKLGVTAGMSLEAFKNLYFYVNNNQQPASDFYLNQKPYPYYFSTIYDKGITNVFSLFTEVNFMGSEDLYTYLKLRWNSYNTGELEAAYHRPEWIAETDIFYQLVDKINFNVNFYAMGGIKAMDENGMDITLDPAIDLNVKIDYLLSDRASIFVKLNNIFSQNYMLLHRYPVRGFQVMGGITYNF